MTGQEKAHIPTDVVATIARHAARGVPGVHSIGAAGPAPDPTAGVAVQVGPGGIAVELELITRYGHHIPEVTSAVRRAVVDQVRALTGVRVVGVDITVDDVFVDEDGAR